MTAKLRWSIREKDDDGFPKEDMRYVEVYALKKSIKRTEFYESMRAGIQVNLVLEVRQEDFALSAHETERGTKYADSLEFEGTTYKIIRTYETGKGKAEIVCS